MINKWTVGLIVAIASGTTAQVWIMNTPAIASVVNQQENDSHRLERMETKLDQIYEEVRRPY